MAHGEIWFDSWTMHFQSETAPVDFPLQDLRIELGENNEHLRFTHRTQPGWTIYVAGFGILEHYLFSQRAGLKEQSERILERSGSWHKLIYVTLGVVAAFVALAFIIFQLSGSILNYLVGKVPPKFEASLGDETLKQLQHEANFVTNKKQIAALTEIGEKVLPPGVTNRFRFRYYIVEYPAPNAFALPGGNVIVTTALLEEMKSEEIAGVLAHETAHVLKRHGLRHIIATAGPYLLLGAFFQSEDGFLATVSGGAHLLIKQNFSQQFETEADDMAWEYLIGAKVNPHRYIDALEKLKEQTQRDEAMEIRAFSSHPATVDRIRRLQGKWARISNTNDFINLPALPKLE